MAQITVERACGAILVAKDMGTETHNHWFDETEDGRLVYCSQVVHYEGNDFLDDGRAFIENMSLPTDVQMAVEEYGFENVYDLKGRAL